ncbi:adenosine deaminase [Candidatus Gottesmanbacteria bacterium CG11_big_fil_rev_8_21_14_0_20_37_11]|uniref:adenosine deaminase n=3 Tax=Candidatus Gottesmaniibacteriota TaxID=1752720 RepID=A0A2M7RR29_9BACT|nr:MAG: adenosine deaminase [Candidatus Gottesmanbacteria bacterium CG23_combo_of_CG06-09_8_20_14_all_37_19]PIR08336.1 MAG: adenosine deaminase [Candidatus Gottesmanbacteria bacterium CG11_big_fil_rev_8_21_14_0_20_37_11]PIZ02756.1 MAG: adenosine deaminase [Candidatus Gottesmanbacteria bacterium CG_4_10_14_0_8_um_filter_37_24]
MSDMINNIDQNDELTELHVHVGSAVDPPIMWEIAHEQGIKLPTKNYWEFERLITISGNTTYESYLELFYWTELIQSSPQAIERSVYSIASGAYRKNNITTLEIRFNPMKRNRGGERDLDHIILASIHGMEKAMIAYPMKVGLIFCLDRSFSVELNTIIAKKAIKYGKRGVVGIDLAGSIDDKFDLKDLIPLVNECKDNGLGVTIHTGEATGPDEVHKVIDFLLPNRIGHGVRSIEDESLLIKLSEKNIVLEICPSSNIHTGVVKNLDMFKYIFAKLNKFKVPYTINTDGPEMLKTNLVQEYQLLLSNNIISQEDLLMAKRNAKQASFIKL